ncbi:fructose-1-phosphate kinase [Orenia metallireducens]|uniref:Tagatose-6-phosphate kinase n=1 Tax=Orenia metallireducens TaxID=1413210 RepID=A0A285GTZ7_9FIRM|nr:1-phosphofructokinase [Orenia metallireducens]PRX25287.1 fructose-1-phosphate kinase [Orenia metallireducens]SNY27120.1 fructose-1-phosphate kinase [Orenia metallireducens]
MITTLTINPAVDYTVKAPELRLGKVNRVEFVNKAAAGKGINVSKGVKNLGEETMALGCIGGDSGQFIVGRLKELEISSDFTWIQDDTRINMKVIDDLGHETKINQLGSEVPKEVLDVIEEKVIAAIGESEIIVLAGSLPPDCPEDFYQKLIKKIKEENNNVKVFLDASQAPLKLALEAKPSLIKPNLRELGEIYGKELSVEEAVGISKTLVEDGIEMVLVSLGAEGAILTTKEGTLKATPPEVEVVSTIGAGDSVVAAMAVAYLNDYKLEEMFRFAIAMSIATILRPGAEMGRLEEVNQYLGEIKIDKLELLEC